MGGGPCLLAQAVNKERKISANTNFIVLNLLAFNSGVIFWSFLSHLMALARTREDSNFKPSDP
jgi:hypothetical protein